MLIPAPSEQRPGTTRTLLRGEDGAVVKRTVLPGGLRVISEYIPAARSVAVGFWVGVGSRDEKGRAAGASHFLEHLLFKGTARRTAFEISAEIEAVGGDLNAFTTKECTCFDARVLADDLPLAIDILADMVTSCTIDPVDVDFERNVVLEELAMYEDEPAEVAHQAFSSKIYGSSPLSLPIIGTVESLKAMPRSVVYKHYKNNYRPNDVVVTAAGAVDHAQLVREVKKQTRNWAHDPDADPVAPRVHRAKPRKHTSIPGTELITKTTEQAQLVLGVKGVPRRDQRRWALAVLDVSLGGGMSSRLFQEVREKRGLVYSVHTFQSGYSDAGIFGVYAGTSPDKIDTTVDVVRAVLADAAANGVNEDEVKRAKGQLRGASIMKLEDAGARMHRLGEAELLTGEMLSLDEIMERIDGVSSEEVADAAKLLAAEQTITIVGPYEADRTFGSDDLTDVLNEAQQ